MEPPIVDPSDDRWRCPSGHTNWQREPGSRRIVECESCAELAGPWCHETVVRQKRHLFDAEERQLVAITHVRWADRV